MSILGDIAKVAGGLSGTRSCRASVVQSVARVGGKLGDLADGALNEIKKEPPGHF